MDTSFENVNQERTELYDSLRMRYNPEGSKLRKYQRHLTKVLVEFDEFCNAHGIKYWLAYGTLLGAVRHHGFIPWDDDADLWMDRENYQKLTGLMKGEWNQLTDSLYVHMGIRPELWSPPYAYIDIFIIDSSPDNLILRTLKQASARFCYAMIKSRSRFDAKQKGKFKLWDLLRPVALLRSTKAWKKSFQDVALWYTHGNTFYESQSVQVYNECFKPIKRRFPAGKAWDIAMAEFEGHMFPIPKDADTMLKICYGDYMSIPDHDHIHVHNIVDNVFSDENA